MTDTQANKEILRLLGKADDLLEGAQRTTEARLLQAYKQALTEVQGRIQRVFAEAGGAPTITALRKFDRLASIEKQLADKIKTATKKAVNITSQSTKSSFTQGWENTKEAFRLGTGLNLQFDKIPSRSMLYEASENLWLDLLKQTNGQLMTDVRREFETVLRTNARQEVISGLAQGKPYREVTKAIKNRFDVAATRARKIAFTEMHKAHSAGRLEGILAGSRAGKKLGFDTVKVWKHNGIGDPRPGHLAASREGLQAAPDGMFELAAEKGGTFKTLGPGLSGLPEEDIFCHCSAQFEVLGLDDVQEEGVKAQPKAEPPRPPTPSTPKEKPSLPPTPKKGLAEEAVGPVRTWNRDLFPRGLSERSLPDIGDATFSPYTAETTLKEVSVDLRYKFNVNFHIEETWLKGADAPPVYSSAETEKIRHAAAIRHANSVHDELLRVHKDFPLLRQTHELYPIDIYADNKIAVDGRRVGGIFWDKDLFAHEVMSRGKNVTWGKNVGDTLEATLEYISTALTPIGADKMLVNVGTNGTIRHELAHFYSFRFNQLAGLTDFSRGYAPWTEKFREIVMTKAEDTSYFMSSANRLSFVKAQYPLLTHVPEEWADLWFKLILEDTTPIVSKVRGTVEEWASESNWFTRNVGKYAGHDIRESWAECLGVYTNPLYKTAREGERLPKVIEGFFEKLLSQTFDKRKASKW